MYYKVVFRSTLNDSSTSIKLYSHYTGICGEDSGEGETHFVSQIEDKLNTGEIVVDIYNSKGKLQKDMEFIIATQQTLLSLVSSDKRYVIMMDELSMIRTVQSKILNKTKSLIIGVTRAVNFNTDCHLKGLYKIERSLSDKGDVSFDLKNLNILKILSDKDIVNLRTGNEIERKQLKRYDHKGVYNR